MSAATDRFVSMPGEVVWTKKDTSTVKAAKHDET